MPMASVNGVDLYWEETGHGAPLVWLHEYGGDLRSWEPQVRYFFRRYRVVTYNHRGCAPSTMPRASCDYSQDILVEDLRQLLTHLGLGPVHLGGCSVLNEADKVTLSLHIYGKHIQFHGAIAVWPA